MPPHWRAGSVLSIFGILAITMVALVLVALRDVAVEPNHRLSLVAATVLTSALSAWIITRL